MFEAFFHREQDCLGVTGLDVDDAVGMKADARKARREKITPANAPDQLAGEPSNNAGDKKGRGGTKADVLALTAHFMQGTQAQAAIGQMLVYDFDPERQGFAVRACLTVQALYLHPKVLDNVLLPESVHPCSNV